MMMVYFPEYKLLYASDLLQPSGFIEHYNWEVIQAVKREKLEVEKIYSMHLMPMKYQDLLNSMQKYLAD
ncbi:MAG TPA: hypothetical protein VFN30_09115, partial [Chitinophagaceae bacterium]|nr:hypothetical protein [Chitinophagaceae bacterium]